MANAPIEIIGRTGSLFTRLPLIFAEELGVQYILVKLDNLADTDPAAYGGNRALRIPVMREAGLTLFGAQNICRALADRSASPVQIVWPEDMRDFRSCNAQELVWHGMAAQVQILMGTDIGKLPADNVFFAKATAGLEGSLSWLDEHVSDVIASLPEQRTLSLFEVSLYCLLEHLQFAATVSVEKHTALLSFAQKFGMRISAQRTAFR